MAESKFRTREEYEAWTRQQSGTPNPIVAAGQAMEAALEQTARAITEPTVTASGPREGRAAPGRVRARGIEQLVLAGFMTQMCCDSTARQAAHRGFKVLLPADAMAAMSLTAPDGTVIPHDQVHRTHLASLNGFLATVTTTAAVTGEAPAR